MGGDVILAEAKRRIGHRVCIIGGFDQFHSLINTTPEATRAAVRSCFEAAGEEGGYILCPSDHFFDADPNLVRAYADEGQHCMYTQSSVRSAAPLRDTTPAKFHEGSSSADQGKGGVV